MCSHPRIRPGTAHQRAEGCMHAARTLWRFGCTLDPDWCDLGSMDGRSMYQHVSMMAVGLSGAACAARRRAVFHAMGVQTMRRRLAFPPVLTCDKRRAMARDKPGTTIWARLGAAWSHTSGQGSRWRGGHKALTMPLPPAKDGRAAAGASPRTLAIGRKGVLGAQGPVALTGATRTLQCRNGSEQRAS
jgi:hypothetical protein